MILGRARAGWQAAGRVLGGARPWVAAGAGILAAGAFGGILNPDIGVFSGAGTAGRGMFTGAYTGGMGGFLGGAAHAGWVGRAGGLSRGLASNMLRKGGVYGLMGMLGGGLLGGGFGALKAGIRANQPVIRIPTEDRNRRLKTHLLKRGYI